MPWLKKGPAASTAQPGEDQNSQNGIRGDWRRQAPDNFVPPRLRKQLPQFKDMRDVDFAVALRALLRRSSSRGLPERSARASRLATELVLRRARQQQGEPVA